MSVFYSFFFWNLYAEIRHGIGVLDRHLRHQGRMVWSPSQLASQAESLVD